MTMLRRLFALGVILVAGPLVTACDDPAQQRCLEARDPGECRQVARAGGNVSDYLMYGMAGYMLSSAINGQGQRQPVIVADPGYHGYRRPIASYQASPAYVHQSTTVTTTTRHGLLGGTRTTVRTTTVGSRPSWSPQSTSSYRTSYSSFRSSRR